MYNYDITLKYKKGGEKVYKVLKVIVKNKKNKKALYSYFYDLCMCYKNLKNVANFHIRQHMTGLKEGVELNPLQSQSISLFNEYIPKLTENSKQYIEKRKENILKNTSLSEDEKKEKISKLKAKEYSLLEPSKWFPGYETIDGVLKLSKNVDYYSVPGGVSVQAIKEVTQNWKGFFALNKKYSENSGSLLGKPKIPKYLKGPTTVCLNNVVCKLKKDGKNKYSLRFPKTNEKLSLGSYFDGTEKLVEVKIIPVSDYFVVSITTDTDNSKLDKKTRKNRKEEIDKREKELKEKKSNRVVAIDIGQVNIVTMTNNIGLRPILIKGNVIVQRNKYYLDKIAEEQSIINKGKDPKDKSYIHTNKRIKTLYAKRDRMLYDYFHKVGKFIITFCKENNIDTLIIGHNIEQKQNLNMGIQNQNYAYIPFSRLYNILSYLCLREGIKYEEIEESYTSKSSFFGKDIIPTYKDGENEKYAFSGYRPTRDVYKSKKLGYCYNADVNGSLNIMRKYQEDLTKDIKISDVSSCVVLSYYSFLKTKKKTNINGNINKKRKPSKLDFHKIFN